MEEEFDNELDRVIKQYAPMLQKSSVFKGLGDNEGFLLHEMERAQQGI